MVVGTTSRGRNGYSSSSRGRNVILRRLSSAERRRKAYHPNSVDSSGTNTNKVLILLVVAFTFAITDVFLNDSRRMGMGGNHNIPKIQDVANNWLSSSGFIEYRGYKDITSSSSSATPQDRNWNNYHRVLKKFSLRVSKI